MSSEKIDSLTPEQEAKIPEYVERYRKIGTSTEPTDRAKAEAALKASYVHQKKPVPTIEWYLCPFTAAKRAAQLANGIEDINDVTDEMVREQAPKASFGSFEAQWVVSHDFIVTELKVKHDGLIDIVKEIIAHCGVYFAFEDDPIIVVSEKPSEIHMNAEGKLHNLSGPAIKYRNGSGVYAINGERKNNLSEVVMAAAAGEDNKEVQNG